MKNNMLLLCTVILMLAAAVSTAAAEGAKQQNDWLGFGKELAQAGAKDSPNGETLARDAATVSVEESEAQALSLDKPFEIKLNAYMWVPSYKGRATVRGRSTGIDVSYNDMFHLLDEIECMVPLNVEARWKNWGVIVDLFYVRLEDQATTQGTTGPTSTKVRFEQEILELAGFYRLGTWPVGKNPGTLSFDMLGGARYNRLQGNLGLESPPNAVNLSGTQEWWDPFVGPRVTWKPTNKWTLFGRGDVGGFGLENCSHFVWQIVAGAQYDITKNIFVEAGYRLLDTDYETGSGTDHFAYDVQMRGPYMALGIKF